MKKITVVIPNLNGMAYLEGCLKSLYGQSEKDFEVILIDNGSSDQSIAFVRSHFPEVRIRAFHSNTGFCRAVNEGILLAKTPYVLLLNNDTVCDRDMVGNLLKAMEEGGEGLFSCCAKMVSLREPDKLDCAGDFFCMPGWTVSRGRGQRSDRYGKKEECFSCCAAAALYRRAVFDRIGLFDEKHFAYLEDVDLGWRARRYGYRNVYLPSALVWHAGSATSGSRYNAFKVKQASGNNLYMIWKNSSPLMLAVNALPFLAGIGIKGLWFAKRGLGRPYLAGLRHGLALIRGTCPGTGPVWAPSQRRRMEAAGMIPDADGRGKRAASWKIEGEMIRDAARVLTSWR